MGMRPTAILGQAPAPAPDEKPRRPTGKERPDGHQHQVGIHEPERPPQHFEMRCKKIKHDHSALILQFPRLILSAMTRAICTLATFVGIRGFILPSF